jgi:hypothetical protein
LYSASNIIRGGGHVKKHEIWRGLQETRTGDRKHNSTYIILLEKKLRMAAPCLRTLVTGISPRRSGFNYKPVHVGFVVDEVAKSFLRVLRFTPSVTIHDCSIHTHPSMTVVEGRDHLEELDIGGRILKYIFKK